MSMLIDADSVQTMTTKLAIAQKKINQLSLKNHALTQAIRVLSDKIYLLMDHNEAQREGLSLTPQHPPPKTKTQKTNPCNPSFFS
jgi:hypothetical protein